MGHYASLFLQGTGRSIWIKRPRPLFLFFFMSSPLPAVEKSAARGAAGAQSAHNAKGPGPAAPVPWRWQPVEKPLGVRGPQCSSQRSRCVGPWGLPGAPLLTGLPPRSSRHWRRSALPSGGFDRIWRRKVNCPEGTREGPLGGVRQIRKKPCVARVSLHSSLAAP